MVRSSFVGRVYMTNERGFFKLKRTSIGYRREVYPLDIEVSSG